MQRHLRRLAVVLTTTATLVGLPALPALASAESVAPGPAMNKWLAVLLYVVIPLSVLVGLALLVYGPDRARRPRYRPGNRDWRYAPVWIGGPTDAAPGSASAETGRDVRGGGCGAGW